MLMHAIWVVVRKTLEEAVRWIVRISFVDYLVNRGWISEHSEEWALGMLLIIYGIGEWWLHHVRKGKAKIA